MICAFLTFSGGTRYIAIHEARKTSQNANVRVVFRGGEEQGAGLTPCSGENTATFPWEEEIFQPGLQKDPGNLIGELVCDLGHRFLEVDIGSMR